MKLQAVLAQYRKRVLELQGKINDQGGLNSLGLVILAVLIALVLGLSALRGEVSWVLPVLPLPVGIWALRRFLATQRLQFREIRLKRYYERAILRVEGEWGEAPAGDEFADADHVYTSDLNCFGEGSLFQLLCTVRTAIGRRRLAEYLSESPTIAETLARQDAVRELRDRADLQERVAVLGEHEFLESRAQTFEEWLDTPAFDYPAWLPVASLLVTAAFVGLVIAGLTHLVSWRQVGQLVLPGVMFHVAVGMFLRETVNPIIASVRSLSGESKVLREGLALLAEQAFQSAKLKAMVATVGEASAAIGQLERPLAVLAQRDQDWFYGPSRFLLAGTLACIAIEKWRRVHGQGLRAWMDAWGEFEALVALGTYSYENPDHTFPVLATETGFVAKGLGHPLLQAEGCVVNDVELRPFYVVSGSNMSGKSTLLRSIGLNAVLAFMGAPVRAAHLRLSGLSIVASLSVGDSLMQGRSKFKAEVERLRQAIESKVEGRPVLFLVDEIFSGTNSRDRRVAAEAVVRTLVQRGAIGALSTHDLALAEIAGEAAGLGGINVHMGSRDGSDPMDFDYRLKLGVTTEANALAIARMAGVPV